MKTKLWLKSSSCWVLDTGLYTYFHKLGIIPWEETLEDFRRVSSSGCQKKVARDATVTALLNRCSLREREMKVRNVHSSLLKEWYPGWGWGSLPLDEAQESLQGRYGTDKTQRQSGQPRQILLLFHAGVVKLEEKTKTLV